MSGVSILRKLWLLLLIVACDLVMLNNIRKLEE